MFEINTQDFWRLLQLQAIFDIFYRRFNTIPIVSDGMFAYKNVRDSWKRKLNVDQFIGLIAECTNNTLHCKKLTLKFWEYFLKQVWIQYTLIRKY